MDTIYGFEPAKAGMIYTELLERHVNRDQKGLKESMQALAQELYGLGQNLARELAEAELNAFLEHNAAESADTPEQERERHWRNVEQWLKKYYLILERQFRQFGITIFPAELAAIDLAWWKEHNHKEYTRVRSKLAQKYMKLYKLDETAAALIADKEIAAIKLYDKAKVSFDDAPWSRLEAANVEVFRVLKRELRKVHKMA